MAFDAGVDRATAADDTGVGLVVGISGIGVNETVAAAAGAAVGWGVLAVVEEVAAGVGAGVTAAFGLDIGAGVG